jgi:tripartite-type tricarboxylate transporter receptor subunit TctC
VDGTAVADFAGAQSGANVAFDCELLTGLAEVPVMVFFALSALLGPVAAQHFGRALNMKFPRRQFLQMVAGAAMLQTTSRFARAQTYPTRPVRIIVGYPAGGNSDTLARLISEWLSKQIGRPFIVENRPGAAGNIAAEAAVRSAPDGYTLLFAGSPDVRNEMLYADLKFSFIHDTAPVASIALGLAVLVVHPSSSIKSVPELIAAAKAKPNAMTVASAGIGTIQHLSWALFSRMTGTSMLHMPYRGGAAALTDLLGEQVQVYFAPTVDSIEFIKAGRLRALGVTAGSRTPTLPDVPTIGEFVPGFEVVGYAGIVAPKNTPADIIDILNKAINAGLANPGIKQSLADLGQTVVATSPAEFGKLLAAESEKWGTVIREANIKM